MQKKRIFLILIFLMILVINRAVFAFDLNINVNPEKTEQNTINIILQASDLGENPEGINALSGKLIYDSNVFDKVDFKGKNNWSAIYNNEEGNDNRGKFVLITTSGNITEDTDVANIELTLKSDLNNVQTQIKVENIQTSYQSNRIQVSDKNINIEINNNNIKIVENKTNEKVTEERKNYNIYILSGAIIVICIVLVILIIKKKEKRTNEK